MTRPPSVRALHPRDPARLGPWQLTGRLGSGGAGTVYLGRDSSGATAAVKAIRADVLDDDGDGEALARFAREAAVMAGVDSPAVARLLGADVAADPAWIAVQHVPGPSLWQRVGDHGPLPLADWSVLATRLLDAVAALHRAGVVHRDLSPGNVILGPDGPVLIDFGQALSPLASRVTRADQVRGTPGYMSPEQLAGAPVGAASDVYSAACLLVHAATGRPPHGGGSRSEVQQRGLRADVDVEGLPWLQRRFLGELLLLDPAARPSAERAAQLWREVVEVATVGRTLVHAVPRVTTRNAAPSRPAVVAPPVTRLDVAAPAAGRPPAALPAPVAAPPSPAPAPAVPPAPAPSTVRPSPVRPQHAARSVVLTAVAAGAAGVLVGAVVGGAVAAGRDRSAEADRSVAASSPTTSAAAAPPTPSAAAAAAPSAVPATASSASRSVSGPASTSGPTEPAPTTAPPDTAADSSAGLLALAPPVGAASSNVPPGSSTGASRSALVTAVPTPAGDPTTAADLAALQQAALARDYPFPGGRLRFTSAPRTASDGTTSVEVDITADFARTVNGGYRLRVFTDGMGGSSAWYWTCLRQVGGTTVHEDLFGFDNTARDRWTSIRVELDAYAGCSADPNLPPTSA
ncbi:protein kinase domain-containing protein [Quadrisphaera sp. KR29]|uniref:protein kinase domain-containing protein n=1 Tax=Quadrisphaera sp. KR29 TaxID=3461391 RepID=UPI0040449AA3